MKENYKGENEWKSILIEVMGSEAYMRLCDCVSKKKDVPLLAKAYKRWRNLQSEDALITALEHMGDNSQIFDYTEREWKKWLKEVESFK